MRLVIFASSTVLLLAFSFSYLLMHPPPPVALTGSHDVHPLQEVTPALQELPPAVVPSPSEDIRIIALRRFLQEIESPLADHAQEIVKQADLNGLDYALVPAISMQESGGCKTMPENSHNCWGYGIYGSKVTRFDSYPKAIAKVTKTIKETYIKNGYTNPTLVEDRWTPSSKGEWSYSVNFFMNKIHGYER